MTTVLTYLQFHLAFLVPLALFLIATGFVSRTRIERGGLVGRAVARRYWGGVAIVTGVALVYTIPWDNYLIARGCGGTGRTQPSPHWGTLRSASTCSSSFSRG
ncbi:hypothetical protein ACFQFH_07940 [Halobaculum halobium]|uniref:hypothetical protein n=1 Tax=Halobaculum halobium TaxID=3032281 RepID=UPI0036201257